MRTMLILLLLCSLAPFAAAQLPPRSTDRSYKIIGCEKPYECFTPKMCSDNTKPSAANNAIEKNRKDDMLYDDCPALITIYTYRKYWAEVTIESITLDTESIVLTQWENQNGQKRNEFTCEVDANDPTKKTIKQHYSREKTPKAAFDKGGAPIKCVFQIKLQPKDDIFGDPRTSTFQFKIKGSKANEASTSRDSISLVLHEGCDFSNIEFNKGESQNHVYAQVHQEKDQYSCKHSFEMEYVKSGKKGVKLECDTDTKKFTVDGIPDEYPDIRCVAEAKYFCKYEPKVKANEQKLDFEKGDIKTGKESKLECPSATHPYLFVKDKPVLPDGTIKCLNYGGSQIWTVMKDNQKLAKNGVEAYCAKEVPCEIMYKLTQSKIPNGQVSHEFYPICHGDGVLKDMHDQLATKFSCDKKTGTYKYFSGDNEIDLKDVTFKCIYPDVEKRNDAERTRINNRVTYWSVGVGVGSGVIILIGCLVSTFVGRHVHKKAKAKRQAEQMKDNEAKYLQFAMNKEERAKDARRHHVKPQSELSEASDTIKWSDMSLEARYEGLTAINPREGTLAEKRIDKSYPVLSLTPDLVPNHKLHTAELPAKFSERLELEIGQIQRHRDDANPKYTSYLPYGFQQKKKCNLVENSK